MTTDTQEDCPNCNGRGRFHEFVKSDRAVENAFGSAHRVVGGECDRCNGTGEVKI